MLRAPSTDDVEVATYDFGGTGEPLLLAHATGFNAHVLQPLARHLGGSFHSFALDERGHGASTPPGTGKFDWHGFADDVLAAVDALALDRPFAFGHSAGGAALLLAEQKRPGTFRGLWLYEPVVVPQHPPPPPRVDNPLASGARRRRDRFPTKEVAYENYASKPPFDRLHPDTLRAYVEHGFEETEDGDVRLRCRPENEARVYENGFAHGAFGRMGEVECPVTIACGEFADTFDQQMIEAQAAPLPNGRTRVLPGLSHFGPLEDPHAVADAVVRDLAGA